MRASGDSIDLDVADAAVTVDDEGGWLRDTPVFPWVVKTPLLHDTAVGVSQDREGQGEVSPQRLRLCGCIDGDDDQISARSADGVVVIAVVRQLAVTKRSPMASIEQQDHRPARHEGREPPWRTAGVRQLKVRSDGARDR